MRSLVATLLFSIAVTVLIAQQPTKPVPPAASPAASADEAADRADLQKMKALVQQMQTNLAFVTSTQGPLKHQFELEIEMWQLEIARLERRLGQSGQDATRK